MLKDKNTLLRITFITEQLVFGHLQLSKKEMHMLNNKNIPQ